MPHAAPARPPRCVPRRWRRDLRGQLVVEEFLIPRANAFPHDPACTVDGVAWYTDQNNSYIGRFDPVTRAFTD